MTDFPRDNPPLLILSECPYDIGEAAGETADRQSNGPSPQDAQWLIIDPWAAASRVEKRFQPVRAAMDSDSRDISRPPWMALSSQSTSGLASSRGDARQLAC
jgi:hypothetical protein